MAQALLAEDSEEAALKLSGDALLGAVLEAKREHYGPAAPVEVPAYGPPPPAPGGERHAAGAAAGAPGAPPEGAPEEQLQDLTQRLSRYGASKDLLARLQTHGVAKAEAALGKPVAHLRVRGGLPAAGAAGRSLQAPRGPTHKAGGDPRLRAGAGPAGAPGGEGGGGGGPSAAAARGGRPGAPPAGAGRRPAEPWEELLRAEEEGTGTGAAGAEAAEAAGPPLQLQAAEELVDEKGRLVQRWDQPWFDHHAARFKTRTVREQVKGDISSLLATSADFQRKAGPPRTFRVATLQRLSAPKAIRGDTGRFALEGTHRWAEWKRGELAQEQRAERAKEQMLRREKAERQQELREWRQGRDESVVQSARLGTIIKREQRRYAKEMHHFLCEEASDKLNEWSAKRQTQLEKASKLREKQTYKFYT